MRSAGYLNLLLVGLVLMISAGAWAQAEKEEGSKDSQPAAQNAAPAAKPAAPAPAKTPPAAKPADNPSLATGDQAYELKLKELEEKVNQLKEKIFRSKARLMLLQETILHGVIAGSKAVIVHKNDLGGSFRLESVAYYLDGSPIYGKLDIDGSLSREKEVEIYNGTIQPGNHMLSAYLVYRGSSGMFTYVEGVQVKLKSSYTFKAEEGKVTRIEAVGYDKGGVLAKFEDRPAIRYDLQLTDLQEEKPAGDQKAGTPKP